MKTPLKTFIQDWDEISLAKVFEIPVFDKRTSRNTWVIFDISIYGRSMFAQHEPLSKKQEKSKKIAFVKIPIDTFFSIDVHLNDLYCKCIDVLIKSDFFDLIDE